MQCSPPKQNRPNLATPRKLGFDENLQTSEGRTPKQRRSPTSKLSPNRQETPPGTPILDSQEKMLPVARLFADSKNISELKIIFKGDLLYFIERVRKSLWAAQNGYYISCTKLFLVWSVLPFRMSCFKVSCHFKSTFTAAVYAPSSTFTLVY